MAASKLSYQGVFQAWQHHPKKSHHLSMTNVLRKSEKRSVIYISFGLSTFSNFNLAFSCLKFVSTVDMHTKSSTAIINSLQFQKLKAVFTKTFKPQNGPVLQACESASERADSTKFANKRSVSESTSFKCSVSEPTFSEWIGKLCQAKAKRQVLLLSAPVPSK